MHVKTKTCLLMGAVTALWACSNEKTPEPTHISTVEIVATHAFDTQTQIETLAFVPNNVAPWLGRLILLDTSGHIFSTDIEGRTPLEINSNVYRDIFGLSLDNAAGVFLAVNDRSSLEAFIESDDNGGFSPMTYSGSPLKAASFCKSTTPMTDKVKVLSVDGNIVDLTMNVQSTLVEHLETNSLQAPDGTIACAYDAEHIFVMTRSSKGASAIKVYEAGKWRPVTSPKNIAAFSPVLLNGETNLGYVGNGHNILHTFSQGQSTQLVVNNGLSIMGLAKTDFVTATTSNYGGAAFKDGVIVMIDANEQRIVFISRDYAGRKISQSTP